MKKASLILLICIYSLSSFGIGIKQFYCCGKLKSTDVAFVQQDSKEKCSKSGLEGCCKTSFKSLKVKDSHIAADNITPPAKHFTGFHLPATSVEIASLVNKPLTISNASHAPPLHFGVSIYILNCVYRI